MAITKGARDPTQQSLHELEWGDLAIIGFPAARKSAANMSPMQAAESLAAKLGVTIFVSDRSIRAEAPTDHHWTNGEHQLVVTKEVGNFDDLWFVLMVEMEAGIVLCGPRCEYWGERQRMRFLSPS